LNDHLHSDKILYKYDFNTILGDNFPYLTHFSECKHKTKGCWAAWYISWCRVLENLPH